MSTVLLALGDGAMVDAVRGNLSAAGHVAIVLERPLAAVTLAERPTWDIALVDSSAFGRDALLSLAGAETPIVGIGFEDSRLAATVPLPLRAAPLLAAVAGVEIGQGVQEVGLAAGALRLDPERRFVIANGQEAALTRTEYRLLEYLIKQRPRDVSTVELLDAVWGFSSEGRGGSVLVRAHVRNLRAKLARVGLPDVIRSRRNRGYALVA